MSLFSEVVDLIEDSVKKDIESEMIEKRREIALYRKEASRLASMANKRVQRLESNNLESTPAYKEYLKGGRFMVRGKDQDALVAEVARMKSFINSVTSTVRGANKVLVELAQNTGIKYSNLDDLKAKAETFFDLSSKVEQYMRNLDDSASAIGYQKIWETINHYVDIGEIELDGSEDNMTKMVEVLTKAIESQEELEDLQSMWYSL